MRRLTSSEGGVVAMPNLVVFFCIRLATIPHHKPTRLDLLRPAAFYSVTSQQINLRESEIYLRWEMH